MKAVITTVFLIALTGCPEQKKSSDSIQREAQERILAEGTAQTGMPAIKNFRERKTLKLIYELRDQESLLTHTYIVSQATGKLVYLCASHGYAINDATGYTNPEKVWFSNTSWGATMPQAEPNGLFTPDNSNAYWVTCLFDKKASVVFVASEIVVTPIKFAE
jgi:hypothetical protein